MQLEEKCQQQQPTTGNSDVAAKTGNNYISGNMTDSVEIPATTWVFSTTLSSIKV